MATLAIQQASQAGATPSFTAAAGGGDQFANTGNTALWVKNGGGSPITVTVDSKTACSYGSDHDITVVVPNGADRIIGNLPKDRFSPDGFVNVTYTGVTSVTVAAIQFP